MNQRIINEQFQRYKHTKWDTNEHFDTFRELTKQCEVVAEFGVESVYSTWAFLQGLLDNNSTKKQLICVDLNYPKAIEYAMKAAKQNNIDMCFIAGDSAKVPLVEVDLLFIDTWHIYGHLKRELEAHHSKVKKYIVMHDTETDRVFGESIRRGWNTTQQSIESGYPESEIRLGLQPAIDEFLLHHPEWTLSAHYPNNN